MQKMHNNNCLNNILPPNVDVVIEGRTIVMEPISPAEITDRYVSWLNDPELNRFLEVRYRKQSLQDVVDYINMLRSKDGCEIFAIFTKNKHTHIGNLSITHYNPDGQGYAIYGLMVASPRARELGMGGEATVLMVEYLFSRPVIRRIQLGAISGNYSAWSQLESLGFKREAVLREYSLLPDGRTNDMYRYGMLRGEWLENRSKVAGLLKKMRVLPRASRSSSLETLKGKDICLREVSPEDAGEDYLRWMNDADVMQFLESRFEKWSIKTIKDYIKKVKVDPSALMWAIIFKDRHIGNIMLYIDFNHSVGTISLFIGEKSCWGKGVATESIGLVAEYAFKAGIRRLTAGVYQNNIASIKAFQRCGFAIEAILKEQYIYKGSYVDAVLLARTDKKLKREDLCRQ